MRTIPIHVGGGIGAAVDIDGVTYLIVDEVCQCGHLRRHHGSWDGSSVIPRNRGQCLCTQTQRTRDGRSLACPCIAFHPARYCLRKL